jgi:hypothetical protein
MKTLDIDIYSTNSNLTYEQKMKLLHLNDKHNLPKEVFDFIIEVSLYNPNLYVRLRLEDLLSDFDAKIIDISNTLDDLSNIKEKIESVL